jgi:hypothetical protein
METQTVQIETLTGYKKTLLAPAGYEFDKVSLRVWSRAVSAAAETVKAKPNSKARHFHAAQAEALAAVMADVHGMSNHFWFQAAVWCSAER